jgi:peroxiredoxin
MALLSKGTKAPSFTLKATPDQNVSLDDFKGHTVILAFYPADWSPVCGDELVLFNELIEEFRKFDAFLVGISVDNVWSHIAFSEHNHFHFPLLSDFEPKGAVAKTFGAYRNQDGICERALFVIDKDGIIQWNYLSPVGVNPGADGILTALENMSKELTKK